MTPTFPFGAIVTGVDLADPVVRTSLPLAPLLWERQVLIVPGQFLDEHQQIAVTERFGPVLDEHETGLLHTYVSNTRDDAVAPYGELRWHQDGPFLAEPYPCILLYAVDIEAGAAPTCFASNSLAYEALPDAVKTKAGCHMAVHRFTKQLRDGYASVLDARNGAPAGTVEGLQDWEPSAVHPVVMTHSKTGRPHLFVSSMMTERIVSLEGEEGIRLLDMLLESVYDDTRILIHDWEPGDLVVWDNLAVQHRRPIATGNAVRHLRRTLVGGQSTADQSHRFRDWLTANNG